MSSPLPLLLLLLLLGALVATCGSTASVGTVSGDAGSATIDPTPTAVDTLSSDADDGALPPVEQAEATKHIGSLAQIVKDVQELIEEERTTDAYDGTCRDVHVAQA